jgi:polyisoprenyl-teichoic acid--peptidoglycan teichoic acid transferase
VSIHKWQYRGGLALTLAALAVAAACSGGGKEQKGLIIAKSSSSSTTTTAAPTTTMAPETTTTAAPATSTQPPPTSAPVVLKPAGFPDGAPYPDAVPFWSNAVVPRDLVFVLAIGSDARPGGNPLRANADSIHLLAVDPSTGSGTVMGFPRDSWVNIPGKGTRKINSALPMGGPALMAETIRQLTGLPVHYTVVTAFEGFQRLVDDLGGVHVHVDRKQKDRFSGANFEVGWHHMNGGEALAYSRNRKDAPNGDFSRSQAQGNVLLSALAKMRAEVGDEAGLTHWINILLKHASFDSPVDQLMPLASLARSLDPARITNLVLPGRVGNAGNQSVVFLGDEARKIFMDLRPDAVIGGLSGDQARPAAATEQAPAPEQAPAAEASPAPAPEPATEPQPAPEPATPVTPTDLPVGHS